MMRRGNATRLILASFLSLAACTTPDDDQPERAVPDRARALELLRLKAGAEVALQVGETGVTRVVAMTPRFPVPGNDSDPAAAAIFFLTEHHDAFQVDKSEVASFAVTRVDRDPGSDVRHVTLQRLVDGDPVFQGAITVHMTAANDVFTALGDDFYRVSPPTNRKVLTPAEAALAAARAFGLDDVSVTLVSSERQRTLFSSPRLLDTMHVTPMVFQVAPNDSRFVYQVTLTWNDDDRQMQYQLVLIDAATGEVLQNYNLVNTFSGRVFTASPGATPATDGRVVVSFDGDPTASPQGWVGSARKTIGNNAVAATDLNGNNLVGTEETQPTADAGDSFDFPFSSAEDAAGFMSAAVADAFYLVNDWHDRTYLLGFTESAGNFQTSNLGNGGAQNDEVQVDAQDGAGTNNANFATPPDGQRPRMQMFLFNIVHGDTMRQDGDFDPSVIYHENTHGLSNRLVGGGSTACLNNLQSGGMGEGWSDFMAASFLNDPVIGAYVTGDATVGVRRASMANSPFTYTDIQNRNLAEVHDAGELWAATLWDIRKVLGQTITEQLVVAGMKLTPCSPSMLNARDAIIQADANLNGGANGCELWTAFAARGMGTGASSPSDSSTTSIVTSTDVPSECIGTPTGTTRTFDSTDVPKRIPDDNATGVRSRISVSPTGLDIQQVLVNVDITHTYRGDLVIQVIAPNGQTATLSRRQGGSADNFVANDLDITSAFTQGSRASGTWQLFVRDLARIDVGTINSFGLTITSTN
jgi:subtilisin-like proprotein convertase family protein/Zn-dependent metalloprotease